MDAWSHIDVREGNEREMDEKIEDVFAQYALNVKGKRRIRGAFLLETEKGYYSLKSCQESERRLSFQEKVKEILHEQGCAYLDIAVKNESGHFRTKDCMGGYWVMRRWYSGKECCLQDETDVFRATKHLAKLHDMMILRVVDSEIGVETKDNVEMGSSAKEQTVDVNNQDKSIEKINAKRQNGMDDESQNDSCGDVCMGLGRHTREMKRVYNYIRNKKRKNEMEICLLNSFKNFYEQAAETENILQEIGYEKHLNESMEKGCVVHGSYNYHNILFQGNNIITMNFSKAEYGVQILDLYDFLRKLMEKNSWRLDLGLRAAEIYCEEKKPEEWERKVLFLMLCYPEKYWKLMNFYYNGKKSWMSAKNYEKLQKICEQEVRRKKFLEEVKGLLF